MPEDNLTKDDLVLLMESYRNMITMHQTILDQSAKTIEKLDNIISKQDTISTKQGNFCNTLSNITKQLDDVIGEEKESSSKIDNHHEKSIDIHNRILTKIHLGWIGMGTIIIGLIGLIITLSRSPVM